MSDIARVAQMSLRSHWRQECRNSFIEKNDIIRECDHTTNYDATDNLLYLFSKEVEIPIYDMLFEVVLWPEIFCLTLVNAMSDIGFTIIFIQRQKALSRCSI